MWVSSLGSLLTQCYTALWVQLLAINDHIQGRQLLQTSCHFWHRRTRLVSAVLRLFTCEIVEDNDDKLWCCKTLTQDWKHWLHWVCSTYAIICSPLTRRSTLCVICHIYNKFVLWCDRLTVQYVCREQLTVNDVSLILCHRPVCCVFTAT